LNCDEAESLLGFGNDEFTVVVQKTIESSHTSVGARLRLIEDYPDLHSYSVQANPSLKTSVPVVDLDLCPQGLLEGSMLTVLFVG